MPKPLTSDEIHCFREDICRVATRLFAQHGVDGVTLRAIAKEMGCSAMTPYRYFSNKDEIFRTVRMHWFGEFGRRMSEAFDANRDDVVARFEALGRSYLRFAHDEPHAYRLMFQLDRPDQPVDDEFEALTHSTWEPLLQTVNDLIDAGHVSGDPNVIAHLSWVTLHGAVTLHLSGHLQFDCSIDDLADPIIATLLAGSSTRPVEEIS
jgi:AcrR family transcriptional regulator